MKFYVIDHRPDLHDQDPNRHITEYKLLTDINSLFLTRTSFKDHLPVRCRSQHAFTSRSLPGTFTDAMPFNTTTRDHLSVD